MSTELDLDTRLRRAGASLHRAVDLIPADTPPQASPKSPNRVPLLAAAAAVLIVVALAAVALSLRGDDEPPVTTDPGRLPRLLAQNPVAGMELSGAADLPLPANDAMAGFRTWFALYRNDAGDEVGIIRLAPDPERPGDLGEPNATVRGHEARIETSPAYGTTVRWEEDDELGISLMSDDLDGDALVAAADDLEVDEGEIRLGGDFTAVAIVPDLSVGLGLAVSGSMVGHIAGYETTDDSGIGGYGASLSAGATDVAVLRWMGRADEPIEVQGHDGWIGRTTSESATSSNEGDETTTTEIWTVIWEEGPGVVGVAQVYGLDRDAAVALAESLRPVDQETWEQLLDDTDSLIPRDAQASMEDEDGDWAVYLDADGQLCSAAKDSDSTSVSGCSDPSTVNVAEEGEQRFVYGVLPDGAAGWRDANGDNWFNTDGDGDIEAGLYSFDLGDAPVPEEVVFIDAEGNEVRREPTGGAAGSVEGGGESSGESEVAAE